MYGRKAWRAHQLECHRLLIDGVCLQKKEMLVLLESAKKGGTDQDSTEWKHEKQVYPEKGKSPCSVCMASEGKLLSLSAENSALSESIGALGARLEAMEQRLESLLEMGHSVEASLSVGSSPEVVMLSTVTPTPQQEEEDTYTLSSSTTGGDDDTDHEDKLQILCEKRGRRYYRIDTDEPVLRKNLERDEESGLFYLMK